MQLWYNLHNIVQVNQQQTTHIYLDRWREPGTSYSSNTQLAVTCNDIATYRSDVYCLKALLSFDHSFLRINVERLLLAFSYINMNNTDQQIRTQFLRSEASMGITKETFTKRFLYAGDASSDSYLLDRYAATPSQLQGLTIEQEKGIGYLMGEMIFRAGESLRLPVSTTVVAAAIAHYFYSRAGFLEHDFRDVAMGAIFLACKSEETLRKSFEVAAVFDQVFKVFQGQRAPVRVQVINSTQYEYMRRKVIEMENQILFALGFQVYRLFDIPHRYIGGLFKTFDRHPECRRICQLSWIHLNDFYRTNCPLFYPGPTIAAAAVYLALLKLGITMPSVPWWVLIEAHLQGIEELIGQLETFYEAASAHRYSLEWVGVQLNEVGDRHQLVNVFPVNYYRKIILDINSQLKIKKEIIPQPQPQPNLNSIQIISNIPQQQQQPRSDDDSESRERSRQKRKKKEKSKKDKKDKRKKKEKRRRSEDSRSSRSDDRNKHKRRSSSDQEDKPQLQQRNNDETPKVTKPEPIIAEPMIPQQPAEVKSEPVVKQLQVGNSKDLLSKISSQLKIHQIKRQQEAVPMEIQPPINKPPLDRSSNSDGDSDEDALAELIQIRKSRGKGKEMNE